MATELSRVEWSRLESSAVWRTQVCWVGGSEEAAASHNFSHAAHKVNSIFVIISIIFPFGIIADNLLNDQ